MAADKELAEEDTWPSTLAKSPVPTGQAPAALDSIFCHLVAMSESHVLVSRCRTRSHYVRLRRE